MTVPPEPMYRYCKRCRRHHRTDRPSPHAQAGLAADLKAVLEHARANRIPATTLITPEHHPDCPLLTQECPLCDCTGYHTHGGCDNCYCHDEYPVPCAECAQLFAPAPRVPLPVYRATIIPACPQCGSDLEDEGPSFWCPACQDSVSPLAAMHIDEGREVD